MIEICFYCEHRDICRHATNKGLQDEIDALEAKIPEPFTLRCKHQKETRGLPPEAFRTATDWLRFHT